MQPCYDDDEDADYHAFLFSHRDPDHDKLLRLCHADARGLQSIIVRGVLSATSGHGFAYARATISYRDGSTYTCTGWAWVDEFDEGTPTSWINTLARDRAFANAARAATGWLHA